MIQRTRLAALVAACIAVCHGSAVLAEDAKPAVAATLDIVASSTYIFRGQVLNDEPVVQPALTVTRGGLSLATWGNFNLTDSTPAESDFSEVDLTATFSGKCGPVGWSVGIIEYLFPHQTLVTTTESVVGGVTNVEEQSEAYPGTREVTVGFSLPDLPIVPAINVYCDLDEARGGIYAIASLAFTVQGKLPFSTTLSSSIGYGTAKYNNLYFAVDQGGFNDVNVGLTLSYAGLAPCTIAPFVTYTALLDEDIADAAAGLYKDTRHVTGGVKISCAF